MKSTLIARLTFLVLLTSCSEHRQPTVSNVAPKAPTNGVSRGDFGISTNDLKWFELKPAVEQTNFFTVTNFLRFGYTTVVCVNSNDWAILTNTFPTNVVYELCEFMKPLK